MANFSLWDPRKNQDYVYIDEMILDQFQMAATSIFVHKYLGIKGGNGDPTEIEDPVFGENRNRKYDPNVYELLGVHNVQDMEFALIQFGQIIQADIVWMTFHINDSVRRLGRKFIPGDVFEIPHLRDDLLLDPEAPAINKYYVVEDVTRAAEGFSSTWFPHLFRVKLSPMKNSEEYEDITGKPAEDINGDPIEGDGNGNGSGPNGDLTIADIISDYNNKMKNNKKVVEEAERNVDRRNFETQQFYVVPGDELGKQYPWIFAGDGNPPNGAEPIGKGTSFPLNATDGDWYLRTDYDPNVLFRKDGAVWRRQEVDWRKKWQAAHRILESFINNRNKTTIQGDTFDEKQAISKVIRPRADF